MIVSAHQPQYIPWLGYFDKIAKSDRFVFLDNVQYKEREFQNRNKIRTKDGSIWLTVPVISKGEGRQNIRDVKIDNELAWQRKHLGSLRSAYASANFFNDYYPFFEEILARDWIFLKDLNIEIIRFILKELSISTPIAFESELKVITASSQRIVDICKNLEADTYLSGSGGRDYLDEKLFARENIKLLYQDFKHPGYKQCFQPFEPFMSTVDLLFNHGKDSREILFSTEAFRDDH
jgi:hypothetical protein